MNRMTIGMMTFSFSRSVAAGSVDVPGIIRLVAPMGVEGLDLSYAHWKTPDRDIPATLDAMAETGVSVASCHASLDLVTRSAAALRQRQADLRVICTRLAEVKCGNLMLGSPTADLGPDDWRREYGVGLAEAAPVAADFGITITFENRGGAMGAMVGTFQHCLDILAHAADPRVRFTFDVANFHYVDQDPDEAFDRLVETVVHVHLKDVARKGDSFAMVPLGDGEVDNRPTIRKLRNRGYTGCLAIECGGRDRDAEDAARSVEFVKRALAAPAAMS